MQYEYISKMLKLGAEQEMLRRWIEEVIQTFEKEPDEEQVLITTLQNFSREKKAAQSYQQNLEAWDARPQTPKKPLKVISAQNFRRTTSGDFGGEPGSKRQSLIDQNDSMRKTSNSFSKTKRSSAISSSESLMSMQIFSTAADPNDDDNAVSELISNND